MALKRHHKFSISDVLRQKNHVNELTVSPTVIFDKNNTFVLCDSTQGLLYRSLRNEKNYDLAVCTLSKKKKIQTKTCIKATITGVYHRVI